MSMDKKDKIVKEKNQNKRKYIKIGIISFVILLVLFLIIFSPSLINKLSGNVTSIDTEGTSSTTGVILNNKYFIDKTTNSVDLQIYNGASSSIVVDSYVYCNTDNANSDGTCTNYTKKVLDTPITISANDSYTLTVNNVSSLLGTQLPTEGNVYGSDNILYLGVNYTLSNKTYIISNMDISMMSFDASKVSNYSCNSVTACYQIGTEKGNNFVSANNELTSESFTIVNANDATKNITISLNDNDVYMDKSQNLSSIGLLYNVSTNNTGTWFFKNPQSSEAISKLTFGNTSTANIGTYFDNMTLSADLTSNGSFILSGTPKKTVTDESVVFGLYATQTEGATTYSTVNTTPFSSAKLPQFKLTVYDKSNLKTAIENAITKSNNLTAEQISVDNASLYSLVISNAIDLYYARSLYPKAGATITDTSSYTLTPVTQSEIDTMTNSLNNYQISYNTKADYTALNAALTKSKAITRDNYVASSLSTLDSAISNGDSVVQEDLYTSYQAKVDNATTQLNNAYNALEMKKADYTALKSKYADAIALKNTVYGTTTLYTTTSWNTLQSAINNVPAVNGVVTEDKNITEQATVDGYLTTLTSAMSGLEKNSADYTGIDAIILSYQSSSAYTNNWYTDEGASAVNAIIATYDSIKGKGIDEQGKVDSYQNTLQTAISNLTLKLAKGYYASDNYVPFDGALSMQEYKTKFESLIKTNYTDSSKLIIEDVLDAFDKNTDGINNITIDNQVKMDTKLRELNDKLNSLVEKLGNYEELCKTYDKALNINKDYYELQGLDDLDKVIWSLEWDIKISKQDKIDEENQKLKDAIAALVLKKADLSKLTKAYNRALKLNSTLYTNYSAVLSIVNKYDSYKDATIDNQAEVDNEADKLNAAIDNLVLKDADYSKIDALESLISQLNPNLYENYDNLKTIENSIVYGKKITSQDEVDTMYTKLKDAYDALKLKSYADYTKFKAAVIKLPQDFTKYSAEIQSEAKIVLKDIKALPLDLLATEQTKVDSVTKEVEDLLAKLKIDENTLITTTDTNVEITSLKVNGEAVDVKEVPFKHKVEYSVTEAKVEVELSDKNSTYEVYGGNKLLAGDNEITIVVTTQDKKTYSYKLIVTRKQTSNYLENLSVKNNSITFEKTKQTYTIKVNNKTNKLDLSAIAEDKNAEVKIKGNDNLKNGSKVTIEVKGQDGKIRIYTLDVQKTGSVDIKIIVALLVTLIILAITFKILQRRKNKTINKSDIAGGKNER